MPPPAPTNILEKPSENTPKTLTNKAPQTVAINNQTFKSFTLKSINERKEILKKIKPQETTSQFDIQNEPFSETEFKLEWLNFAKKIEQQGEKLIYSLFTLNEPQLLKNYKIIHTVPNGSSKLEFERIKPDLLGYLRGKLKNHNINLEIREDLNGEISSVKLFNKQDKLKRFIEINPDILLLQKIFDLEID